jgi:hypothetical protein
MRGLIAAALVFLFALMSAPASAAEIRGSVERRSVGAFRPVPYVLLTLRTSSKGRSARIYSSRDGEFWFHNVPQGIYVLEIWRNGMPDVQNPSSPEACRVEVTGPDISLPRLRLHNSPLRTSSQIRDCRDGLEHLYVGG